MSSSSAEEDTFDEEVETAVEEEELLEVVEELEAIEELEEELDEPLEEEEETDDEATGAWELDGVGAPQEASSVAAASVKTIRLVFMA